MNISVQHMTHVLHLTYLTLCVAKHKHYQHQIISLNFTDGNKTIRNVTHKHMHRTLVTSLQWSLKTWCATFGSFILDNKIIIHWNIHMVHTISSSTVCNHELLLFVSEVQLSQNCVIICGVQDKAYQQWRIQYVIKNEASVWYEKE